MNLWRVTGGLVALACLVSAGLFVPLQAQDKKAEEDTFVFKAFGEKDKEGKLVKGAPFFQKLSTSTTQEMKVEKQGQPAMKQVQTQTFIIKWTPTKVEDGKFVVEQKIEYVKMDISIGSTTIAYDSDTKDQPKNPMTEFFDSLMNVTLTLNIDDKMKVTKVEGGAKFVEKLGESHPQMKNLLKSILSDNALIKMSEQTWNAIPTKAVKKGDKWDSLPESGTLSLGAIGTYKNSYSYVYDGKEKVGSDELGKITVTPVMVYEAPPKDKVGKDEQLPFDIKGGDGQTKLKSVAGADTTGTVWFDFAKGRIAKSNMKMKVEGVVVIGIGGNDTRVELTQTQSSELTTGNDIADLKKAK
jgi:hypothetical protein